MQPIKIQAKEIEGMFFDGEIETLGQINKFLKEKGIKTRGYTYDREENIKDAGDFNSYTKVKAILRYTKQINIEKLELEVKDFIGIVGKDIYVWKPDELESLYGKDIFEGVEFNQEYFRGK